MPTEPWFTDCEVIWAEKNYKPIWPTLIVEMQDVEQSAQHPRSWNEPTVSRGEIIAIGDGVIEDKQYKSPVEIWDVVIFTQYSGDKISAKLRIIGFRHVLAKEC